MRLNNMRSIVRAALLLAATSLAVAGCSRAGSDEVSYVGPEIEGVRDIRIVNVSDSSSAQVLPRTMSLGDTFIWLPDGERAIVLLNDEFYVAEVERDFIGECLTCEFDDVGSPSFSPDGSTIAWPARDGVYLQSTDDYSLEMLAHLERPGWLSWSPDGKSIAFARRDGRLAIYRLDIESGEVSKLTSDEQTDFIAPAYSPTRDQIAYHTLSRDGFRLMVMEADGSEARMITEWQFGGEAYDPGLQDPPTWSPNGDKLVFTAVSPRGDNDIFVVEVDSGEVTNLTNSPGADKSPVWSADGKMIAFASHRDGNWEIYVMNADGSDVRNISHRSVTPEMNPQWRP